MMTSKSKLSGKNAVGCVNGGGREDDPTFDVSELGKRFVIEICPNLKLDLKASSGVKVSIGLRASS